MKIPTSCPQTRMTLSPRSPTAQRTMPIQTVWTVLFILPNKVLFWNEFTGGFLSHCLITFNVVLEPLCLTCSENHYTEDGFELGEQNRCLYFFALNFPSARTCTLGTKCAGWGYVNVAMCFNSHLSGRPTAPKCNGEKTWWFLFRRYFTHLETHWKQLYSLGFFLKSCVHVLSI